MNPLLSTAALAATAALAQGALTAQCQGGLLYTTKVTEQSNQCTLATSSINAVEASSLQLVQPNPASPYRSGALMPRTGYDVTLGDGDFDGVFHEPTLFGAIDATVVPRQPGGALLPLDKTAAFFSTKTSFTDVLGTTMDPGDIGRVIPAAGIEFLIEDTEIKNAFGIPATEPIDVDAAAMGFRPGMMGGDLYLSFEDTEILNIPPFGPIPMFDGAVLRIPAPAMTFAPSPHDGAVIITSAAAFSGQILADEALMDSITMNSMAADASGVRNGVCGDVDGLTLDPAGGSFQSQWTPSPIPHFFFVPETLTGGGVVSTAGAGTIAVLNGVPLANNVLTSGSQVGLVTPGGVNSLAGISITACNLSVFTMDTPTPVLTPAAPTLDLDIGGSVSASVLTLIDLGCNIAGCIDTGIPVGNPDYSRLMATTVFVLQPTGADGCGRLTVPFPPALVAALSGQNLLFQAVDVAAPGHVSNPVKISF